MRSLLRRLGPALALVLLAGCAGAAGGSPTPPPGPSASPDPGLALLRLELSGGLMAPGSNFTEVPVVAVYADGRAVFPDARTLPDPQPAFRPLLEARLAPADLDALLARARALGLADRDRLDLPTTAGVADAPTTFLRLVVDGRTRWTTAYALGFDSHDDGQPSPGTRAALATFVREVGALVARLPHQTYVPSAFAITASAYGEVPFGMPAQTERSWPLDASLPLAPLATSPDVGTCRVVTRSDAATLRDALASANAFTPWRSAGVRYRVIVRPLLPDESACPSRDRFSATPAP